MRVNLVQRDNMDKSVMEVQSDKFRNLSWGSLVKIDSSLFVIRAVVRVRRFIFVR